MLLYFKVFKTDNNFIRLISLFLFIYRFRSIVLTYQRLFPDFSVDVDAEIEKYVIIADRLKNHAFTCVNSSKNELNIFYFNIDLDTENMLNDYVHWSKTRFPICIIL